MSKKVLRPILAILMIVISLQPTTSQGVVKEGTSCKTLGRISGKFTCVSLNSKNKWMKVTLAKGSKKYPQESTDCYRENLVTLGYDLTKNLVPLICLYPNSIRGSKPPVWFLANRKNSTIAGKEIEIDVSEKHRFASVCELDPNSPMDWAELEKFLSQFTCTGFYKYVTLNLPNSKPKTPLSGEVGLLKTETCKITQPNGQYYPWRGFANPSDRQMTDYFNNYASPRPNMKIQAIPLSWSDYPDSGNPNQIYGKYFTFLKEYIENISDNGSNVTINIPNKYFQMPKPLSEYRDIDFHGTPTPNKKIFWDDAISASDPEINFSGVTVSIIVVTPNTPIDKFGGNPDGNGISAEGQLHHILTLPPLNTKIPHKNSNFLSPQMMIHELTHAGLDMGDYYGTGIWSHVGAGHLDYLGWDKYISGFFDDSEIFCLSPNETSVNWIVPSSAKGNYKKLIVVPLSTTKVLVIESIRSAGYKYKLQREYQGALVYTVDVSVKAHGEGTDVYRADGQSFQGSNPKDDTKSDAPLQQGEFVTIGGVKISVIESGNFGEVIKIEKI